MRTIADLSDDEIAEEIVSWAGRIAAAEARLLALVAEFDRRAGWAGIGILSCAHWLTWRTGLGPTAARERVRVARALGDLPRLNEAFHAGRVSWSQVRAITRVATPADEAGYVDLARHTTAAQLERVVRGVHRAQQAAEDAADPEQATYRMRVRRSYDLDGTMVLTIRASAQDGAVIDAALEQVRADLDRRHQQRESTEQPSAGTSVAETTAEPPPGTSATDRAPEASAGTSVAETTADASAGTSVASTAEDAPAPATAAEALLEMARMVLERQAIEHPDAARRNRSRLVAQIDPLSGWGRLHDGEILPPSALQTVLSTLPGLTTPPGVDRPASLGRLRLRSLTPADLTREDLGRSRREPSLALRELLASIDGERCRMPGCTRTRKLHAHHVQFWSDQGPTDLANLVLLCSRHHTLIHQHGFTLTLQPDRTLTVTTADGVPVLHHPALPWGDPAELDPDQTIDAQTLPPDSIEARMELGYVVAVVMQQAA